MKISKLISLAVLFAFAIGSANAQRFLEPSFSYSGKKISYITLNDGSTQEVFVISIKREKGLIEELKIEDKDGKKSKLKPEQIKHMYLPQSGWDKMNKSLETSFDVQKWDNDALDPNKFAEGYVYFEQAEVQVKKEKLTLMMQLLNPAFCKKIKVYHDPYAAETASVGIGGFTVAGGDDKSFYVSVRGGTGFKLAKKDYKESFRKVFGVCTPLEQKFPEVKWSQFDEHVFEHNQSCE